MKKNCDMAKVYCCLLALGTLVAPGVEAKPIDPNNPPQGRFADDWMEIYMANSKVGYAHSTMARQDDFIVTSLQFHIRLGRVASPVTIEMVQTTRETIDGRPVTFSSETNMATMKTGLRGEIKGDRVTITTSQLGMEQKAEHPFPVGALMTWGLYRESLLRGMTPGLTYTLKTYSPDLRLDGAVEAITKLGDWEEIELHGKKVKGLRSTVTMQSPIGAMEMISWSDRDANVLKSTLPVPGLGDMVLLVTDEKKALADFVPPEVFMTTVVKAKKPIDFKAAKRIAYRITSRDTNVSFDDLPETDAQRITKKDKNLVELTVSRVPHKPSNRPGKSGHDAGDMAEFMAANLLINVKDPELVKLARRAKGAAQDPFVVADKLRRFVTDYVEDKNLNIGFATASEVARTKEGDCSEHGVLLAALGRIVGLPSRVVVGLAYVPRFGNREDIFGYHLWTQFYIDGRWIDFDAALRETDCSPIRIAFATSSLKNAGLADLSLPLLSKIGAIDIDVLKIEE